MPSEKQEKLPGTFSPATQAAIKKAEILTTLFDGLQAVLSTSTEGLPANGETQITIARMVRGDMLKVTYRPGEE